MANIQVTHVTDPNNARSESAVAINPNNPQQIVAGSKAFRNMQTYDFTLATQFSQDGGLTWQESAPLTLSGFTILSDPAFAWDDVGNVYLLGLSANDPPSAIIVGIEGYKSTDGGQTWSGPTRIHANVNDDKQWMAGDGNSASPFHGRLYAAWDGSGGLLFARSKDGGATWVGAGAGTTPTGTSLAPVSFAPEINLDSSGNVYIVFVAGNQIQMVVSRDGGDTFITAPPPATGITTLGSPNSPHFSGGSFRVGTLATACVSGQTVLAAWADFRQGVSRIFFARSTDGAASWVTPASGQPLLTGSIPTNFQHFDPQLVAGPNGVIACALYEFGPKPSALLIDVVLAQSSDGGTTFDDFIITDQPWDPTVDAPWARGVQSITFIGDYFDIAASQRGFYPVWTDTRTGFQDLFTAIVPQKKCVFVINRSTLGQDEVDALRHLPGGAVVADAFRVVVDGFSAVELGLSGTSGSLPVASPAGGMTIVPRGNVSANLDYGPEVQRFTFLYDIDFGATDTAFAFPGPTEFLTLHATAGPASAQAQIELIKQPDPFILHGDPAWLSIDLRVLVVRAGQSMFGVPGVVDAADAPRFIQQVLETVSAADFDTLATGEDETKLYVQPNDENGVPVFNFALAKVHYIGLIGAAQVRVFFRLFQAQSASLAFDFPPGSDYRRATTNPDGQPIPLAGIHAFEYVTLPFFASPRVDTATTSMTDQTDAPNVRNIAPHADGSEVDTVFGCWLDINQPFSNCVPLIASMDNPDGPFAGLGPPPVSIQWSILRSLHQCLIAEIAFDPVPIPLGATPGDWDKLAQRNLAWADVGSARAATTFELRPTPADLPAGQTPDELMIDWGTLPAGGNAFLYMSAVTSDDILSMARRMYTANRLSRVDDHTLAIKTGGISYIPIPAGSDINYAGLLTVEVPSTVRRGQVFNVAVRQITNAAASIIFVARAAEPANWRRVLGAFQLTIPVGVKRLLLPREERDLSVLRWIADAIPVSSRWSQVFPRYVEEIAGRVQAFGGDPTQILPSPTGDGQPHHRQIFYTGRVSGLIFDHFGEFEGFLLEAQEHEHKFFSREKRIEELVVRAMREDRRVTVVVDRDDRERPVTIIVR